MYTIWYVYACLSAKCSTEVLKSVIIQVIWRQCEIWLGLFLHIHAQNLNQKILHQIGRCKAAKKKLVCVRVCRKLQAHFTCSSKVLSKAYIGLGWPVVLYCQCGLVDIYQQPINGQKNRNPGPSCSKAD